MDVGGVWNNAKTPSGLMNGTFIFAPGGGVVASNDLQTSVYTTFNVGSYSTIHTNGFTLSTTFAAKGYSALKFTLGLAEVVNKGHFVNLTNGDVVRLTYIVGGTNDGRFSWGIYEDGELLNDKWSVRAGTQTIQSNDVIRLSITCYPSSGLMVGEATNLTGGYAISGLLTATYTSGLTNMLYAGMGLTSLTVANAEAPALMSSFVIEPAPALLPASFSANQRVTTFCLENPGIVYDIYLPPAYSTNGPPLPIFYTMSPGGGGMVDWFQTACSNLNIIAVGIVGSKNWLPWTVVLRDVYAATRDVRQRVLYDPTAEFVGGLSGGGECSYMFSRFRAQHVAGVLEMAGWLGRGNWGNTVQYYSIDRVQTNLLVARTTGVSDAGAVFYNPMDSNYLATCSVNLKDWWFNGGHAVAPESMRPDCLAWLVSQRIPAGPTDRSNALVLANNWQSRIADGQQESVLRECVSNIMNRPRSWFAHQAQLTLDQLLADSTTFRSLNVSNLACGDFASDLFFYSAYGAAVNADWARYESCLKALTGITVTNGLDGTIVIDGIATVQNGYDVSGTIFITGMNGDRAGDIYSLHTNYNHYPAPQVQYAAEPSPGQMSLWLCKDTPGLSYSVQSRSNLVSDVWQDVAVTAMDTNTIWSGRVDVPSGAVSGYFRICAVPLPAISPPWSPQ